MENYSKPSCESQNIGVTGNIGNRADLVVCLTEQGLKNPYRIRNLILESIESNKLDLRDLVVFTEAASKNYVVTPIIAAMAGASVYAITQDSVYGKAKDIEMFTHKFAEFCGVKDKISVVFDKEKSIISKANIITNLGFVRPINMNFLNMVNNKAVICYMCETWEFRTSDLDLAGCEAKCIPVLGTDEHRPDVKIFDFVGYLCMKMLFDMELEVNRNKIIIVSNDIFGDTIQECLLSNGAEVYLVKNLISEFNREQLRDKDAIILADYLNNDILIGDKNAQISPAELKAYAPYISVIQFAGDADVSSLEYYGIPYYPKRRVGKFRMGMTLADLGPKPIIDLHSAGLKVGQVMARARLAGTSLIETKKIALECAPAQDFIK